MTIEEFLLARISEDEAVATAVRPYEYSRHRLCSPSRLRPGLATVMPSIEAHEHVWVEYRHYCHPPTGRINPRVAHQNRPQGNRSHVTLSARALDVP